VDTRFTITGTRVVDHGVGIRLKSEEDATAIVAVAGVFGHRIRVPTRKEDATFGVAIASVVHHLGI
jgi:hypothetical protein